MAPRINRSQPFEKNVEIWNRYKPRGRHNIPAWLACLPDDPFPPTLWQDWPYAAVQEAPLPWKCWTRLYAWLVEWFWMWL